MKFTADEDSDEIVSSLGAFPHIHVRSGYILWVARFTPFPPNLIKRSLAPKNIGQGQYASLRPKRSLSLTRNMLIEHFNKCQYEVYHIQEKSTQNFYFINFVVVIFIRFFPIIVFFLFSPHNGSFFLEDFCFFYKHKPH